MTKYFPELLKELNEKPELLTTPKFRQNMSLVLLFRYAFMPELKFLLPETEPPYKKDAAPLGMTPTSLSFEIKKLYKFTSQRADWAKNARQQNFINLLEAIHPSEADILLAIKDQDLPRLYPNLTKDAVSAAGYLK